MIDEEQFKKEVQEHFPKATFEFETSTALGGQRFLARSIHVQVCYSMQGWMVELGGVYGGWGYCLESAKNKTVLCVISGRIAIVTLGLLPEGVWSLPEYPPDYTAEV